MLKNEKTCWRYHHFTHVYQQLQYMINGSWETEWKRQNFLSFWAIFCSFTPPPLMILKIKILEKKEKMPGDVLSTYRCTINEDHMIYGSWNIRCNRQKFSSFCAIFCPFSPLTTWTIKILTLKKAPGDIIISHICTISDNHMMSSIGNYRGRLKTKKWKTRNFII